MDEPALFVSEAIDFRDAVQKAEDAQDVCLYCISSMLSAAIIKIAGGV